MAGTAKKTPAPAWGLTATQSRIMALLYGEGTGQFMPFAKAAVQLGIPLCDIQLAHSCAVRALKENGTARAFMESVVRSWPENVRLAVREFVRMEREDRERL
jgi:hypothetical protein